jgi:RNA polymerase sigma factor (sigma-70 family)
MTIDLATIHRAQRGDTESLAELSECATQRLLTYLYRLTLDYHLAQDLAQETVLALIESLPRLEFQHTSLFWSWLHRTAFGKLQHHYKQQGHRRVLQDTYPGPPSREWDKAGLDGAAHRLIDDERKRAVMEAIRSLKLHYRHILTLRCLDGLSYAEIATIQGGTELQARLLFFRAKAHLRQQLARRGYDRRQMLGALALFRTVTSWHKGETTHAAIAEETLKVGPAVATAGVVTSKAGLVTATLAACLAITTPWITGLHASTAPRIDPIAALAPAEASDVDRIVASLLPETDSITVALIRHGRLAFAKSYGAADILCVAPYASISKSITALLVMQQVEHGRIKGLDEPFWNYCPQYQGCMPDAFRDSPVTLRHLLCHTSGVPDRWYEPWQEAGKLLLRFRPGTEAAYSSAGYSLVGQVLEHVTGQPYEDLVQQRVARPLGLRSMAAASGPEAAFGGIYSNIEDFARLAIGIMDGALVTTDTLYQQVWRRQSDLWGGYGLGWFVQNEGTDELVVRHAGLTDLVSSHIVLRPRHKDGVVLFATAKTRDQTRDMMRLERDALHLARDLLARFR